MFLALQSSAIFLPTNLAASVVAVAFSHASLISFIMVFAEASVWPTESSMTWA
eukprot:CAMPEP_0119101066 /NCGR_PEP_ID=MMETSP1180-20130426/200_1 /TAXON_ID=3052 ORGANISM="Chlamydomonas cf sp, Strain CCMP681" /NCGR_SAMPLE_ID=MMETSP1180 /ASSEMBLY_ACC=CAM_ASM_000741 /LENGTH=52 /DNA_ID=CAMNT_0007085107 /DNA_START=1009 /DNA_END=1167 /DNA_ORIENTATION=-